MRRLRTKGGIDMEDEPDYHDYLADKASEEAYEAEQLAMSQTEEEEVQKHYDAMAETEAKDKKYTNKDLYVSVLKEFGKDNSFRIRALSMDENNLVRMTVVKPDNPFFGDCQLFLTTEDEWDKLNNEIKNLRKSIEIMKENWKNKIENIHDDCPDCDNCEEKSEPPDNDWRD